MRDLRAGLDMQQYAGFRWLSGLEKDRILRKCEMNTRLIHFGNGPNASLQLTFERPAVVHLLGEIRRTELRLIEELETQSPRARQTRTGELQTRLGHRRRWPLYLCQGDDDAQ
jgi:hypothetical protein